MRLNVYEFMYGDSKEVLYELSLNEAELPNVYDYPIVYPVDVNVMLFKADGAHYFSIEGNYIYKAECDRCLESISRKTAFKSTGSLMERKGNIEEDYDSDEIIFIEEDYVDLEEYIWNQIISSLPMKFLCSEDCKGLCPQCGKDLNLETCDCVKDSSDLRFEKLRGLSLND